jgi:hypothetical protein
MTITSVAFDTEDCAVYTIIGEIELVDWRAGRGKLYKSTERHIVNDGVLVGAAFGLAASITTLFMQRPATPHWT